MDVVCGMNLGFTFSNSAALAACLSAACAAGVTPLKEETAIQVAIIKQKINIHRSMSIISLSHNSLNQSLICRFFKILNQNQKFYKVFLKTADEICGRWNGIF
jgi:hypothetical protein